MLLRLVKIVEGYKEISRYCLVFGPISPEHECVALHFM